jgi:hypothetical protein
MYGYFTARKLGFKHSASPSASAVKLPKVGTGCKEAGKKNYVGNISGNLQHL